MKKNFNNFLKNFLFFYFFFFFPFEKITAKDLNIKIGENIFLRNCNVCHNQGSNIIIPEKNLKIETLRANGMDNLDAIIYQVINGKNGMPAFGGRLKEDEIENVANYILEKSINDFQN
jgi:cytochrome c6